MPAEGAANPGSNKCVQVLVAILALGSALFLKGTGDGESNFEIIQQIISPPAATQPGAAKPDHAPPIAPPPPPPPPDKSEKHKKKKKNKKGKGGGAHDEAPAHLDEHVGAAPEEDSDDSSYDSSDSGASLPDSAAPSDGADDGGWETVGDSKPSGGSADEPSGYYKGLNKGLSGDALKRQLHAIIQKHEVLDYRTVWEALESMDEGQGGCGGSMVKDIYSGKCWKAKSKRCGAGETDKVGLCYNREHTWPQSWWGGVDAGSPATTDIVHLFLADGYVNKKRSNLPLGRVAETHFTSPNGAKVGTCAGFKGGGGRKGRGGERGTVKFFNYEKGFGFVEKSRGGGDVFLHLDHYTGDSKLNSGDLVEFKVVPSKKGEAARDAQKIMLCFEPPQEFKGDLARVFFYISVAYQGQFKCCSFAGVEAHAINKWMEDELKVWHKEDPVSEKEVKRNTQIYRWQKNRNPFVDLPELVDRIQDF